jgi:hypothetical protein
MKKTKPYYTADTGYFEHKVKICFTEEAFNQAVKDAKITTRHSALDVGVAESHHIQQEGTQNTLIAIVFNMDEMSKMDSLERLGIIVHETVHTVTHVFEHVGEDETKVGDESRAYFTEYLFKQVFAAYATEEDKRERARERNRKSPEQTNQAIIGALIQMAEHDNGGARPNHNPKRKGNVRRTKNSDGDTKPETTTGV